jgi:hypothetical protein
LTSMDAKHTRASQNSEILNRFLGPAKNDRFRTRPADPVVSFALPELSAGVIAWSSDRGARDEDCRGMARGQVTEAA